MLLDKLNQTKPFKMDMEEAMLVKEQGFVLNKGTTSIHLMDITMMRLTGEILLRVSF